MNICLVVLIGLPAAGKSSFSRTLQERLLSGGSINCLHLCFDKLVELDKIIEINLYKATRDQFVKHVEATIESLISSNASTFILIDDNNYYRSMRYKFLQLAKKHGTSFAQIYLAVDTDKAIDRDSKRNASVGPKIIEKMSQRLEEPRSCVKWEQNTLKVQIESIDYEEVLQFLEQSLKFTERQITEKKVVVSQSETHKLDLALRKLVGEFLSNAEAKKVQAQVLNEKRRNILQDIKNGILTTEIIECELRNLLLS